MEREKDLCVAGETASATSIDMLRVYRRGKGVCAGSVRLPAPARRLSYHRSMIDLNTCGADEFLLGRRALHRELSAREGGQPVRVAVLGGSTTNQLVTTLELLLLDSGFRPVFHQGEYGRFYEETVHDAEALVAFRPDIVYLHRVLRHAGRPFRHGNG